MWPDDRCVRECGRVPFREDRSDHAGQRWRRSCSFENCMAPRLGWGHEPGGWGPEPGEFKRASELPSVSPVTVALRAKHFLLTKKSIANFSTGPAAGRAARSDLLQVMTNFR